MSKIEKNSLYWADKGYKLDLSNVSTGNIITDTLIVSAKVPDRTQHYVLGKCTEELGEIASIINKPDKVHSEPLEGEVSDIIISAIDLLYVYYKDLNPDLSSPQLQLLVTNKLNSVYFEKIKRECRFV